MSAKHSATVERLLTVAQVAELLGTSERFPRRLILNDGSGLFTSAGTRASPSRRWESSSAPDW